MPQRVQLRRSSTPGDQPSSLLSGEMAVNQPDKKIWLGDNAGVPIDLLSPFFADEITANFMRTQHDIIVGGRATIAGGLVVGEDALVLGALAANFMRTQHDLTVGGNATIALGLDVGGATTLHGALTGTGPVNLSGALTATGNSIFTGPVALVQNYGGYASLGLFGNGSVTPNKYLRATDGAFDIINSAYNTQLLVLSDAGDMQLRGGLTVLGAADFNQGVVCEHDLVVNGTATIANLAIGGLLTLFSLTVSPGGVTTLGGNVQIGLGVRITFAADSTLNFPSGSVFEAPDDATALAVGVGPRDVYFNTTSNALTIRRS
jgi:hypothetical protein